MNLTFFIRRPVLSWVMSIILIMLGAVSYFQLTLREYPQITYPIITIESKCAGYSAEIVETQITKILEEKFSSLEGLKTMQSRSEQDRSTIKIFFEEGVDINVAFADILSKMDQTKEQMPRDIIQTVTKADVDSSPVMYLALYGENFSSSTLYDYAVRNLENYFASVKGVATVVSYGGSKPEMHLILDIHAMANYGISADAVVNALHDSNINRIPIGKFHGKDSEFAGKVVSDLGTEEEFNNMLISSENGMILRLSDIGRAKIDCEYEKTRTRYNGKMAIVISIIAQPVANPIEISKAIREKIDVLKERLPIGMNLTVAEDKSRFIKSSIDEVYRSIFEAIILVAITIFLFLRSFRASLIPLVTIPICLITTFGIMKLFGFTINTLTLLSMVLAVGLLVDDAIVVVENIYRYIEKGENPFDAAIKGFSEIAMSVIAMTLTLAAVYFPVLMSSGMTGKLFKEFALTLAGCVIVSGFVAVTLSPMMCARLLSHNTEGFLTRGVVGRFFDYFVKGEEAIRRGYEMLLNFVMRYKIWVVAGVVAFSIGSGVVFTYLPSELAKQEDINQIYVRGLASVGDTFEKIHPYMLMAEDIVANTPEVESYVAGEQMSDESYIVVYLKPLGKDRKRSSFEIAKDWNDRFNKLPAGLDFRAYCPQGGLFGGGNSKDQSLSFLVQGNGSYQMVIESAGKAISAAMSFPFVMYADWDLAALVKEYEIVVNVELAANFGVKSLRSLAETVNVLVSGRRVTTYGQDGLSRYAVCVIADEKFRSSPNQVFDFHVKGISKNREILVPLRDIISLKEIAFHPEIRHYNGMRAITINVMLHKGVGVKEAYLQIKEKLDSQMPQGFFVAPAGELLKIFEETGTTAIVFVLALLFVFLIMAAQFESFVSPFIVMFTVPLALSGAIYTLLLIPDGSVNIFSNIGFITLIGLVTKHGILIVDFANKLVDQGKNIVDAVLESCRMRLRPILMTTFAMVLGSLPLALASGPGSAARRQLGWVIVGGMTIGTLFTLFFLPIMYIYIKPFAKNNLHQKMHSNLVNKKSGS